MNSFRVINAKFRILKGGKIGLSLSIFLLGSMLTLSKTNALATDYFSGVVSNLSTSTDSTGAFGSATTQIRTNTGSTTDTRTSSAYESVVFNPTSWAESTYSAPTFIVDVDTNSDTVLDSSRYNISTTTNGKLSLTLTFDTNANAAAITKDLTTIYNATSVGLVNLNSNSTYNLTTTSNSSDFVSNLIFNGSNNISGATDIEDGNIQLNGGVSFGGTVNAGSIDVLTTSSIIFNSAVDLTAGTTNKLTFYTAGTTNFYGDLTGDIVTTGDNQGTVTFVGDGSGKSQTLTGNVGSSTILDVATLNVGESGVSSNYSTLTVNGNVYANSTVLNNGTTNSSTLILSNGSNITSTITTADAGMGILTLSGSSSVSGQVGTNSNKLKEINAGANGSSSTFITPLKNKHKLINLHTAPLDV